MNARKFIFSIALVLAMLAAAYGPAMAQGSCPVSIVGNTQPWEQAARQCGSTAKAMRAANPGVDLVGLSQAAGPSFRWTGSLNYPAAATGNANPLPEAEHYPPPTNWGQVGQYAAHFAVVAWVAGNDISGVGVADDWVLVGYGLWIWTAYNASQVPYGARVVGTYNSYDAAYWAARGRMYASSQNISGTADVSGYRASLTSTFDAQTNKCYYRISYYSSPYNIQNTGRWRNGPCNANDAKIVIDECLRHLRELASALKNALGVY